MLYRVYNVCQEKGDACFFPQPRWYFFSPHFSFPSSTTRQSEDDEDDEDDENDEGDENDEDDEDDEDDKDDEDDEDDERQFRHSCLCRYLYCTAMGVQI